MPRATRSDSARNAISRRIAGLRCLSCALVIPGAAAGLLAACSHDDDDPAPGPSPAPPPAPPPPPSNPLGLPKAVVDDYRAQKPVWSPDQWYYSRLGTDRGLVANGASPPTFNAGSVVARADLPGAFAGVWTSLLHNARLATSIEPKRLLGPLVKPQYQVRLTGVEIDVAGTGRLKLELKSKIGAVEQVVAQQSFALGARATHQLAVDTQTPLKLLNWLIEAPGQAEVFGTRLVLASDYPYSPLEAAFLWSFAHLGQTYDADSGLVRDRAHWPSGDFDALPATGLYALLAAINADLGFGDAAGATQVVTKVASTMRALAASASNEGVLPHFLRSGAIAPGTEWSTVDTVIGLLATSLACQATPGCDPAPIDQLVRSMNWGLLTTSGTAPASHGFDSQRTLLQSRWDSWGAETFLVTAGFAAASGAALPLPYVDTVQSRTWDGSGFNHELASLFFDLRSSDVWGVSWPAARQSARSQQLAYFSQASPRPGLTTRGLFGLSACEVPEPWDTAQESVIYQVLGLGGLNQRGPNDGTSTTGYPFVAPHYAAMVAAEEPIAFERMIRFLVEDAGILTPLNNVESVGLNAGGALVWNDLKGSWNLGLQALGIARALYAAKSMEYLPYRSATDMWRRALRVLLP